MLAAVLAAIDTRQGRDIVVNAQRFLLFYSGVFALVALTAAVAAGLLAAGKIALSPGHRVAAQAVHRAISLVALTALVTHVTLEIMAHRARPADAFVPFLAHGRTFYMGLGTLASDLIVVIIVTGIVRRRFAGGPAPWAWRALHVTAYLAWPFAILHGLLAGRQPRPYVDWSYGACLAAAALLLAIRYVAAVRGKDTAAQPVPAQPWQQNLATAPPMALSDRPWRPAHAAALPSRSHHRTPGEARRPGGTPVPALRNSDLADRPAPGQAGHPARPTAPAARDADPLGYPARGGAGHPGRPMVPAARDADPLGYPAPGDSWPGGPAVSVPPSGAIAGRLASDQGWWPDLPTDPFSAVRDADLAGGSAPGEAWRPADPAPWDDDRTGYPAPAPAWHPGDPTLRDADHAGYPAPGEAWGPGGPAVSVPPSGAIAGRLVPDQAWRSGFAADAAARNDPAALAGTAGELAASVGHYQPAPVGPHQPAPAGPCQPAPAGPYQPAPAGLYQPAPAGPYQNAPAGPYEAAPAGSYRAARVGSHRAGHVGSHRAALPARPRRERWLGDDDRP